MPQIQNFVYKFMLTRKLHRLDIFCWCHAEMFTEKAVEGDGVGDTARLGNGQNGPLRMFAHQLNSVEHTLAVKIGRKVSVVTIQLDDIAHTVLVDTNKLAEFVAPQVGIKIQLLFVYQTVHSLKESAIGIIVVGLISTLRSGNIILRLDIWGGVLFGILE